MAAGHGYNDVVKVLCEGGANIKATYGRGKKTALDLARAVPLYRDVVATLESELSKLQKRKK